MITNTNMTVMQTAIAGPSDIKTNGGFNHYQVDVKTIFS